HRNFSKTSAWSLEFSLNASKRGVLRDFAGCRRDAHNIFDLFAGLARRVLVYQNAGAYGAVLLAEKCCRSDTQRRNPSRICPFSLSFRGAPADFSRVGTAVSRPKPRNSCV